MASHRHLMVIITHCKQSWASLRLEAQGWAAPRRAGIIRGGPRASAPPGDSKQQSNPLGGLLPPPISLTPPPRLFQDRVHLWRGAEARPEAWLSSGTGPAQC